MRFLSRTNRLRVLLSLAVTMASEFTLKVDIFVGFDLLVSGCVIDYFFIVRDASGCTQNTQTFPIETTKPMITTTSQPVTTVNDASRYYEYTQCKSRPAFTLTAFPNYLLFFEDVKYGAPESGQCETYK